MLNGVTSITLVLELLVAVLMGIHLWSRDSRRRARALRLLKLLFRK